MPPEAAQKAAEVAFDAFRRDYLVASVVVLLLVNGAWAYALRAVLRTLSDVQEKRVLDRDAQGTRLEALAKEMTQHVVKNSESNFVLARIVEESRRKPRGLGPEPTSKVGPSP